MKNIIIYGAGGFGREVYCWLSDIVEVDPDISFGGFLDDGQDLSKYPHLKDFYLGTGIDWVPQENDHIVIAIGLIEPKIRAIQSLEGKKIPFYNLIHPTSVLGSEIHLGAGNIICPHCVLTSDITIGNFNIFNVSTVIGHDVKIGSSNTFSPQNNITGFVTVGNENFFGSAISVAPGKKIGDRNKISAGSVVFRNVKNDCMVMGNPAKSFT